jgi:hypothetical protein
VSEPVPIRDDLPPTEHDALQQGRVNRPAASRPRVRSRPPVTLNPVAAFAVGKGDVPPRFHSLSAAGESLQCPCQTAPTPQVTEITKAATARVAKRLRSTEHPLPSHPHHERIRARYRENFTACRSTAPRWQTLRTDRPRAKHRGKHRDRAPAAPELPARQRPPLPNAAPLPRVRASVGNPPDLPPPKLSVLAVPPCLRGQPHRPHKHLPTPTPPRASNQPRPPLSACGPRPRGAQPRPTPATRTTPRPRWRSCAGRSPTRGPSGSAPRARGQAAAGAAPR